MEIDKIKLDDNGHFQDFLLWDKNLGKQLAQKDGLDLSAQHWQIIELVRKIYLETETTPPMRLLIKAIKTNINEEIANSRYLYRLFPDGPVRLSSKYAGLPKPQHCM